MPERHYERRISFDDFRKELEPFKKEDYMAGAENMQEDSAPQPYVILASESNGRLTTFDQLSAILEEDALAKGADKDVVGKRIKQMYRLIIPEDYNGEPIRNRINQLLERPNAENQISILSLMCGAGKSLAVTQKIKEILERMDSDPTYTDGLLVVTDNLDRMDKYIAPDPEHFKPLAEFFDDEHNKDRICTMRAGDDRAEIQKQRRERPILLMTTQRYFMTAKERIENEFLVWDRGVRPVILFDEHIPLKEVIQITRTNINDVASALADVVPFSVAQPDEERNGSIVSSAQTPGERWEEKLWSIAYWDRIRSRIYEKVEELESLFGDRDEYSLYEKWDSVPEEAEETGEETDEEAEERERFLEYVEQNKEFLFTDDHKPRDVIRAVFSMFDTGALFHCTKKKNRYENVFSIVLDHTELVQNVTCEDGQKTKIILLDGTADIHPDTEKYFRIYTDGDGEESLFHAEDGSKFERQLDMLTIHMVDLATGRESLYGNGSTETKNKKILSNYLPHMHEIDPTLNADEKPVVFTYQKIERYFKNRHYITAHFNNIKGSNEYKDSRLVAQIGLNRMPEWYCMAYYLALKPERVQELASMSLVETADYLEALANNEEIRKISAQFIFADLEQNLFRFAIRNGMFVKNAHYFVFTKREGEPDSLYQILMKMMENRYAQKGAHIVSTEIPEGCIPVKKDNNADIIIKYILSLVPGTEYTIQSISEATGLTKEQIKHAKKGSTEIKQLMESHKIPGKWLWRVSMSEGT